MTRSMPRTASGTETGVAPVSDAKSKSVSGPRELATKTLCPNAVRRRVSVPPNLASTNDAYLHYSGERRGADMVQMMRPLFVFLDSALIRAVLACTGRL